MPEISETKDSILNSIKKLLGPEEEYTHFDTDIIIHIIIHINTFLANLVQVGIGARNFVLTDATQTWSDFLGEDTSHLLQARTYVYIRVKLIFDPPASSLAANAMEKTADELLWRMNVDVDPGMEELFNEHS